MTAIDERPISDLRLAAVLSAVSVARMLIEHDLAVCSSDVVGRVGLVAEELARHSVATTGLADVPFFPHAYLNPKLQTMLVQVRMATEHAVVAVWDGGTAPPTRQFKDGSGIAAATCWNYELRPPSRRVVWCAVSMLPHRVPGRVSGRVVPVVDDDSCDELHELYDLSFLERVRDLMREKM